MSTPAPRRLSRAAKPMNADRTKLGAREVRWAHRAGRLPKPRTDPPRRHKGVTETGSPCPKEPAPAVPCLRAAGVRAVGAQEVRLISLANKS